MMNDNIFATINEYSKRAPVDIEGLIRALGIKLEKALLDANIAGMIEKTKDGCYAITVNERDPITRQRFTLAHELGHYVHHRDKIGDGVQDDRLYRNTGLFQNSKIGTRQETQANQFAAGVLMPWDLIGQLREAGCDTPEKLAEKLCVSVQAMKFRLGVA
jgi:Zn-dependent peptidase ImmA (M78 family)